MPCRRQDTGMSIIDFDDGEIDVVQEHLSHLHWHTLSHDGHVAFPGEGGIRLSMDLVSGNAGILLALSSVTGSDHPPVPFLSTP